MEKKRKKAYTAPSVTVVEIETGRLLAGSEITGGGGDIPFESDNTGSGGDIGWGAKGDGGDSWDEGDE